MLFERAEKIANKSLKGWKLGSKHKHSKRHENDEKQDSVPVELPDLKSSGMKQKKTHRYHRILSRLNIEDGKYLSTENDTSVQPTDALQKSRSLSVNRAGGSVCCERSNNIFGGKTLTKEDVERITEVQERQMVQSLPGERTYERCHSLVNLSSLESGWDSGLPKEDSSCTESSCPNPTLDNDSPVDSVATSSIAASEILDDSISTRVTRPSSPWLTPTVVDINKQRLLPREGYFWQVKLHLRLARNLPATNPRGKIDAYIKVKYRGKTLRRTRTVFDNCSPVWDDTSFVTVNNLEYPMEFRVYNRDVFRKDDYIGRVLVPLQGLDVGRPNELNMRLKDETGRNVRPYIGELNFWMTLTEIPEIGVPTDHRQSLLKQLKTDRQTTHQFAMHPQIQHNASFSVYSTSSSKKGSNFRSLTPRRSAELSNPANISAWCDSVNNFSQEWNRESPVGQLVEEPDDISDEDDWIGENEVIFYQPTWPLYFYEGTKIGYYTAIIADKTQRMPFSQLSRMPANRTDVHLERLYTRSRLMVILLRADNLSASHPTEPKQAIIPKSKLLSTRGLEKAVLGRPIWRCGDAPPSPMASLSVGKAIQRSSVINNTFEPIWNQEFEFRVKVGDKTVLQVEVVDTSLALQPILIRAYLDFSKLLPDWTDCYTLKNSLDNRGGQVILLATLTGFSGASDSSALSPILATNRTSGDNGTKASEFLDDLITVPPAQSRVTPEMLTELESHYSIRRSLKDRTDVGWLYVYVMQARNLAAKDRNGKSDPYCEFRLVNRCAHTSTITKSLNPVWNQGFVFPVTDLYDVLFVTVWDEDKEGSDFLGRLAIPLTQIINRKRRWYALKDKNLIRRSKGSLFLETYLVYNQARAAFRAAYPRDYPLIFSHDRVRLRNLLWKYVPKLQSKIDRILPYAASLGKSTQMIRYLYHWENRFHSSMFLLAVCLVILFCQPYMIVFGLVVALLISLVATLPLFRQQPSHKSSTATTSADSENEVDPSLLLEEHLDDYTDSDSEGLDKPKHRDKKPLKLKLKKAREVMGTLLEVVAGIASITEKTDSLFKWHVPWLSGLVLLILIIVALVTFFVPLRYLLVLLILKKFTKKLRKAGNYDASPLSFILRVPDKMEVMKYRLFRPSSLISASPKNE